MNELLITLFTLIVGISFGTSILAVLSSDVRNRLKVKPRTAKVSSVISFFLVFVSLWFETPTRMGDHIYIERDLANHKATVHTSSMCSKIKKGYEINDTKYYTYTPYFDQFCKKCVYESDAIKLSKKK